MYARFLQDTRGGMAITMSIMFLVLSLIAALVVDVGSIYVTHKRTQAAADAAAASGAAMLPNEPGASAAAQRAILANFASARFGRSPEFGSYAAIRADESGTPVTVYPVAERFQADGTASAIRVTVSADAPTYFARLFGWGNVPIGAIATAGRQPPQTTLTVASGLVSLNSSDSVILNAVLGSMLGTTVDLNAVHYDGLLNARLDVLGYLNALAVDLAVITPDAVLREDIGLDQLFRVAGEVAAEAGDTTAAAALSRLSGIAGASLVRPGDVLRLEGDPPRAELDLMQIVQAFVSAANRRHGLSLDVPIRLAGLDVRLLATVIEPPQMVIGGRGAEARTAQVQLSLTAALDLPTGNSLLTKLVFGNSLRVRLPLRISLASGRGQVVEIDCARRDPIVTVQASTAPATVRIADGEPPRPATLVQTSILGGNLTLLGKASAEVGAARESLTFAEPATQTISASGADRFPVELLADLRLTQPNRSVQLEEPVMNVLRDLISVAASPLLDVVSQDVLPAFGLRIGTLDVTVTAPQCGVNRGVLS